MIISNVHYPRNVLFLLTESKSSAGHKSIHLVLSTASEIREETCTIETGRKLYFHYHWILHCSIWTTCMMIINWYIKYYEKIPKCTTGKNLYNLQCLTTVQRYRFLQKSFSAAYLWHIKMKHFCKVHWLWNDQEIESPAPAEIGHYYSIDWHRSDEL